MINGHFVATSSDISIASTNKRLNGFDVGAGIEKSLGKQLSLRFDYQHIHYQSFSHSVYDPVGNVTKTNELKAEYKSF